MSRELRQVVASLAWLRIDEYFHSTESSFSSNREIVPLLKLVTIFDPSFTDAYLILAHHLAFNLGDRDGAISVIDEGISKNTSPPAPKLAELMFEAAWIRISLAHDTDETIALLSRGGKLVTRDCDPDNTALAMRLLDRLEKARSGKGFVLTAPPRAADAEFLKGLCGHEDDHEGDAGHEEDHDEGHSHIFAGQNPWHVPDNFRRLRNATAAYFVIAFFLLAASASTRGRKGKKEKAE